MQTIYLDISNKGVIPTIQAKQGEVGRRFDAFIFDSGIPYSIPVDAIVSVWYDGESGKGNYTDVGEAPAVVVENNKITVELITQMLSVEGCGIITILINSADGKQIGLWNIPYCVESVAGFESEKAEEYYTAFSKAASELAEAAKTFRPDKTLTKPGSPADAMETGLRISVERSRIDEVVSMRGSDGNLHYEYSDGYSVNIVIDSNGAYCVASGSVRGKSVSVGNATISLATIPNTFMPLGGSVVLFSCDEYEIGIKATYSDTIETKLYVQNKTDGGLIVPDTDFDGQYHMMNVYIDELADVRVGYDGMRYENAGEAVREQVKALNSKHLVVTHNTETMEASHSSSDIAFHVSQGGTAVFSNFGLFYPLIYAEDTGDVLFGAVRYDGKYFTSVVINTEGLVTFTETEIGGGGGSSPDIDELVDAVIDKLPVYNGEVEPV